MAPALDVLAIVDQAAADGRAARAAPPMRRISLVAVVLGALLVAAACSGDDDGGSADQESTPTAEAGALGDPDGTDPLPPLPDEVALPIVFVHGFAGSAQQYESQAMRFVANGYPQERIVAYDHDGAGVDIAAYTEGLAEVIDATLAEHEVEQVYLVGHSRGTGVSTAYLADPDRADKVAKYVAIDGVPCVAVVPCLAPTQNDLPGQAHVEVATSAESFALQYAFLVGEEPEVVDIVPQRDPVEISGRAVSFPANTGREGATLDIWEIDPTTGHRVDDQPHATFELRADGAFGPVELETGAHYEYLLSAPSNPVQHHLYLQPYVRSSGLVRLLSSEPDGATRSNTNVGEAHAAVIAIRMREWYAVDDEDVDGDQADVLEVHVDGETEPVDVMQDFVGNGAIGLHLHDDAASPAESTLGPLPYFAGQPFQSGIDVFLPSLPDGAGTITVTNLPRGDVARPQTVNVPRWPSSGHAISVVFTDFPAD